MCVSPKIPVLKLSHNVKILGDGAFRRGLGLDEVMSMELLWMALEPS